MKLPEWKVKLQYYFLGLLTGILIAGVIILLFSIQNPEKKVISTSYDLENQLMPKSIGDENIVNDGKININQAAADDLMTLPGIGPAKAAAIIVFREKYGAYTDIKDLLYVPGIGEIQLTNIQSYIRVK